MFSYSKVNCFNTCPYKYKLTYLDKLKPIPDERPNNALFIGTACHTGIEKRSVEEAVKDYKSNYKELGRLHEIEIFKLETILPKAIKDIPEGEYEYKLKADDGFIGYIDCLVPVSEGVYDLLDFKTTNNIGGYKRSGQIHIYKYYYEKLTGNKIRDIYYVFIPKFNDTLNESLSDQEIKDRIIEYFSDKEIHFEKIEFDKKQIGYFFARKTLMDKAVEFPKRPSPSCSFCEYKKYCLTNGEDTSELLKEEPIKEEIKKEVVEESLF